MRQTLNGPHVVLMQRVAGGVGVARPVDASVAEDREHVTADGIGVERPGELFAGPRYGALVLAGAVNTGDHRVHHLRGHQHRHRGPLLLVALQIGVEPVREQIVHQGPQVLDVLDAVGPLPLDTGPLRLSDVAPTRQAGPVWLYELVAQVGVGLFDLWIHGWHDTGELT